MKKILTLLLTTLLLACNSTCIFAMPFKPNDTGKIEVTVASNSIDVDGVKIELYRIGNFVDKKYEFELNNIFEDSEISLEFKESTTDEEINERINTLCEYIKDNNLFPDYEDETTNGKVIFDNLQNGLYFLTGPKTVIVEGNNSYYYSPQSAFISVPGIENDEYNYDIKVVNKYTKTLIGYDDPDNPLLKLQVIKKFNDPGYINHRPESITVNLFKDSLLYETVELNDDNNWTYTWEGLIKFENENPVVWNVVEEEINNYKATYDFNGTIVTITNTYTPPSPPDNPKPTLPDTGVLWWPVPILLTIGVASIVIGHMRNKDEA